MQAPLCLGLQRDMTHHLVSNCLQLSSIFLLKQVCEPFTGCMHLVKSLKACAGIEPNTACFAIGRSHELLTNYTPPQLANVTTYQLMCVSLSTGSEQARVFCDRFAWVFWLCNRCWRTQSVFVAIGCRCLPPDCLRTIGEQGFGYSF